MRNTFIHIIYVYLFIALIVAVSFAPIGQQPRDAFATSVTSLMWPLLFAFPPAPVDG